MPEVMIEIYRPQRDYYIAAKVKLGSLEKMAFYFTSFFIITITAIFILACSASAATDQRNPNPRRPFKKIYAFGDSFTDTGNTKSITGPSGFGHVSNPPYGSTFFHRPTNRYSDGRLVIDFVAEALSLPYLPPYRNIKAAGNASFGVNFAVAGSTAINHAFFVKNNLTLDITPESIQTQFLWFNRFLESQGYCTGEAASDCKEAFDDALVWVGEIGINDYAYCIGSSIPDDTIQKLAITTFTEFLQVHIVFSTYS
jgi:hypothetical protein